MTNAANLLLPLLASASPRTLLVADENCIDFPLQQLPPGQPLLTNRFDMVARAQAAGLNGYFSDFDFSLWNPGSLDLVVYRLSKEKAVVHHIANRACELLAEGGKLVMAGGKQEGIKTFAKTIGTLFGTAPELEKHGNLYRVTLLRGTDSQVGRGHELDDHHYPQLREIFSLNQKPVFSKPGLFGWDRIDAGSALLAQHLPVFLSASGKAPQTLLDLGCGYGYLSLMAAQHGRFNITATDNCAAAIHACRHNFAEHGISGEVIAGDCGEGIEGRFDAILCNPPFHLGFGEARGLTEKFLAATRRLLTPKGQALFVVNRFVPLEGLAGKLFRGVEVVLENPGFKVIALAL